MFDEAGLYGRLQSALHGVLTHVGHATGSAVSADLVIARAYDAPAGARAVAVVNLALPLPAARVAALDAWAVGESSMFEALRRRRVYDQVFRPRQLIDSEEVAAHLPTADAIGGDISDAFGLSFSLIKQSWAALLFVRVGSQPAFDVESLDLLERIRPTVARVVRRGYMHDLEGDRTASAQADHRNPWGPPAMSPREVYEQLTRTERRIVDHLRTELTERQIAEELHRSPHTVHTHIKNIYRKLGLMSRHQLRMLFPEEP